MKANNQKATGLAVLITAAAVLCGCGGSKPANGGVSFYTANSAADSMAIADYDKPAESEEAEGVGTWTAGKDETAQTSEKLVYRGSLTIETKEYENSVKALRDKIRSYNGIIESENEYEEGSYYLSNELKKLWSLSMTVRIPTERYEEFMSGGADIGNVISRSSSAENISRRYNDVSAQIEALEKQQKRLLEMMDEAKTIEDMIAVEDRLSEVQYQLNYLKTDRESMDTDVAYSTITISLREVRIYAEVNDTFFSRLANRFSGGFRSFGDTCGEVLLTIVYRLPYLLIIGLILFILKKTGKIPHFKKPAFLKRREKPEQKSE